MSKAVVHTVLCGDRNVLMGMAVSARSALEHVTQPMGINVLGTALTASDQEKLKRSWQHPQCAYIRFYDIDHNDIRSFRSTAYLKSKAAYSRYFIGRVSDVARLIYLDTDMIITRDLVEAAEVDLAGKSIAAVRDISARLQPDDIARKNRLGLSGTADYFNSGFLIIDMASWTAMCAERQLLDISVSMFDRLDSQDQDALNIVFEDKTYFLDVSWNMSQYESDQDVDGVVLHLIGSVKPWHPDYTYKFSGLFFDYLDRTAFAGFRPASQHRLAVWSKKISRKIPTLDMVVGKVRRALLE